MIHFAKMNMYVPSYMYHFMLAMALILSFSQNNAHTRHVCLRLYPGFSALQGMARAAQPQTEHLLKFYTWGASLILPSSGSADDIPSQRANNLRLYDKHFCSLNFWADLISISYAEAGLPSSYLLSMAHFLLGFRILPLFPSFLLLIPLSHLGHAPRDLILHLREAIKFLVQ